jgi:hypothetical protein
MIVFTEKGQLKKKKIHNDKQRKTNPIFLQFCEELFKWQSSIYEECHGRLVFQNTNYDNKRKLLLTQVSRFPTKLHISISKD